MLKWEVIGRMVKWVAIGWTTKVFKSCGTSEGLHPLELSLQPPPALGEHGNGKGGVFQENLIPVIHAPRDNNVAYLVRKNPSLGNQSWF